MAITTTFNIYSNQDQLGGVTEYPQGDTVTLVPEITGLTPGLDYSLAYSGVSPNGIDLPTYSPVFDSNVDFDTIGYSVTLSEVGDYVITIILTEIQTGITSTYEEVISGSDFITFDYIACDTFAINNKSAEESVTYSVTNVQGDSVIEAQTLAPGVTGTISFTAIGLYIVSVDTDEEHYEYVLNTFCMLDDCMTAFIEDLLCKDTRDCTCEYDSSAEIKVIRMFALRETYFMKLQSEYGFNNRYSALTDTKLAELVTIDKVLEKLTKMCNRTYCLEGNCGGTSTMSTNITNNDCGCS